MPLLEMYINIIKKVLEHFIVKNVREKNFFFFYSLECIAFFVCSILKIAVTMSSYLLPIMQMYSFCLFSLGTQDDH